MRTLKGASWVGLIVSSAFLACGSNSDSPGATAGAAGTAAQANDGGAPAHGGAASRAGSPGMGNAGAAGSLAGTGGAHSGGAHSGGAHSGGAPESGGSPSNSGGAAGGTPGAAGVSGSGTAGAAGSGSTPPAKSPGCGKTAPLSAAAQQSVLIDGNARGYLLVPPSPYDKEKPYALIFGYHGSGGSGAAFRQTSFETSAANQAIFVYPDGLGGIWDLKNNGSDAKFFDAIVAAMSANWCIDTNAVFAFGFSYGGWAATQVASARPNVVRAIASIEGGGPQGSTSGDMPVAAMIVHGKNDTAEPIASGASSRDHFVKINGCASTSKAAAPAPCVAYDGCKPKKAVFWCAHEGAHEIPDFAPAGIWAFFNGMR